MNEVEEVTDDISDIKLFDIPVLIIFFTLFFVVALQFFTRYVLNNSLGWTEEIARYLLILMGFVGSITCVRKGKHIYLEFVYRFIPKKSIKPLIIFTESIVAAFFAYAGFLGIQLAQRTQSQRMISLDLPKSFIYYIVVASCFAMALFAITKLIKIIKTPANTIAESVLDN